MSGKIKMNTIFFSRRHELKPNYYVIPFSCSDLMDIDTLVSFRDRTEKDTKVLKSVRDRITLALLQNGYELEMLNFRNMSISAKKIDFIQTLVSQR